MARKLFDREINDLIHSMTELGNKVDGRIQMTIDALRTLDMEKAKYVATSDGEIDGEEHKIEQMCMNLIALQQPIASDLRTIAACLKILTDMEREADQCADICDILTIAELDRSSLALSHVVQMMEAAHDMFRGALDVRASDINDAMKIAAAKAIAGFVTDDQLSADYIIPSALDRNVAAAVAKAVAQAARDTGVARI